MATMDRSFTDVLQDIIRDVQEIIRSEVRLAKTEITSEVGKAKSAGILIGGGAVAGLFAVLFLLLGVMYALSLIMPQWAAAGIVAVVTGIAAAITLMAGIKAFKQVHTKPERTVETVRENVEWVKQQTK